MLQQLNLFRKDIWLACPLFLLFACAGAPIKPQRKKMPELNSLNGEWNDPGQAQGFFNLPIRTGYIDIFRNGSPATFLAVKFSDNSFDSVALSLANSYKPMAQALLAQWAQQQGAGLLIDLRQTAEPGTQQTECVLENQSYSVPVIFLYSQTSANRANAYITLLQSIPAVHCKLSGLSHTGKDGSQLDCFTNY